MTKHKFLIRFVLAIVVLISQVGVVFAAPTNQVPLIIGTLQSITLETDVTTTVTTVRITILDENNSPQILRLDIKTALALGLITADENGTSAINPTALGLTVQIDPQTVISNDESNRHPLGDALATFFAGIADYQTIMAEHEKGFGFGIIAQALWLTQKLNGDSETFQAILWAKGTGDFSEFILAADGSSPKDWNQLRGAILNGNESGNPIVLLSPKIKTQNGENNGLGQTNGNSNNNKGGNKDEGNNNGNGESNKDKNKSNGNR